MIFRAKVQSFSLCSHAIFAKVKVYQNAFEFSADVPVVLTIGTFDGVHVGHRAVIKLLKQRAQEMNGTTVLLTFDPHPRTVLHPNQHQLRLINSLEEREMLLKDAGLDHLVVHPFTEALSRMTPLEYVRELFGEGIKPQAVIIGYDHRFGRNREGSFESLENLGKVFGFSVESIPAHTLEETQVSSTKVREALNQGQIAQANRWLEAPYPLTGTVIKGQQLGRTLGFPTANLTISDALKLIPGTGVYAAFAQMESDLTWYPAMVNIGTRPTVQPSSLETQVEVHFLEGGKKCYGEKVQIRFVQRLRDEKAFDDLDSLRLQLQQDAIQTVQVLEARATEKPTAS
jgi:riboflavin kinase/FMN adenylyltransferase